MCRIKKHLEKTFRPQQKVLNVTQKTYKNFCKAILPVLTANP